jgi:hypothetical protein
VMVAVVDDGQAAVPPTRDAKHAQLLGDGGFTSQTNLKETCAEIFRHDASRRYLVGPPSGSNLLGSPSPVHDPAMAGQPTFPVSNLPCSPIPTVTKMSVTRAGHQRAADRGGDGVGPARAGLPAVGRRPEGAHQATGAGEPAGWLHRGPIHPDRGASATGGPPRRPLCGGGVAPVTSDGTGRLMAVKARLVREGEKPVGERVRLGSWEGYFHCTGEWV